MATGVAGLLLPRRGQQGWLRRRTILRRGLRGPVVGRMDETRLPPYVMVNPAASAQESNGAQPGDLTMREAAHQTNPVLPEVSNQFGTQRYALLFEPGTYGSKVDPLSS